MSSHRKRFLACMRVLLPARHNAARRHVLAQSLSTVVDPATANSNPFRDLATAMEIQDDSRLLALPLELLTRITDNLKDESLPSLRLTCKTLEGATFDRFVRTFQDTHCCVHYESRWLSLKRFLNGSDRLVSALRCVTFTSDPLEGHCHRQVQTAPSEAFPDIEDAQRQFSISQAKLDIPYALLDYDSRPSLALIQSVLLDMNELAPHVAISFDLTETRFFRDGDHISHKDIFVAVASTFCGIADLSLSRHSFEDAEDFTAHLGTRFFDCTSFVHSFTFQSTDPADEDFGQPLDEHSVETLINILQSTEYLFSLRLEMDEFRYAGDSCELTHRLLFANSLASLEHLFLEATEITEKRLSEAIASCSVKLKRLFLVFIKLTETDEGWLSILRSLSRFPDLEVLSLAQLATSEAECAFSGPNLDFSNITGGLRSTPYDANTHLTLETKESVSAGLKELLSGALTFV